MKRLIVLLMFVVTAPSFAGNVIVVHKDNPTKLSLSDAKKIFLGRKGAFNDGSRAVPITLEEGHAIRKMFNRSILNKSESQYSGYWAKMSFTGRAVPPKVFANSQEAKEFIANNVSAIGIMDDKYLDDRVRVVAKF